MKKIAISLFVVLLGYPLPLIAQTSASHPPICPHQLGAAVDAIANRREFRRSHWGILIQTQSAGQTLYNRNAEKYFIPASNVKLMTTAAALQKLGPQFRIRTSIYREGQNRLSVVGRGDPSLTETQVKALAKQLKQQGINQVSELIGDDSYFPGLPINPNWEWEDVQAGYGAPTNSLIFNQNSIELILSPQAVGEPLKVTFSEPIQEQQWRIQNESVTVNQNEAEFVEVGRDFDRPTIRVSGQLRVGSESEPVYVALTNPAVNFLQNFQRILTAEGIPVQKISVSLNPIPISQEVAAIESPPLADLIKETNLESNNVYAEALLRSLGTRVQPSGSNSSASRDARERGLKELQATLTQLGVNPDSYRLADGSGLSRHNLVSPEALVQLLRIMANSPHAEIYRTSLPVASQSGTLGHRFKNTAAQGRVLAKTGTLTGVSALSGYMEIPAYEPLAFSILIDRSDLPVSSIRKAIDEIILLLTRLKRC